MIKTAVDELNKIHTDPEALRFYEAARKRELDYNSDIRAARREGIQQGRRLAGKLMERQLIINNMLKKGYTLSKM